MKDLEDWAAVQKVYKSTKSKRATAELLGISRNTVRKLLDLSALCMNQVLMNTVFFDT